MAGARRLDGELAEARAKLESLEAELAEARSTAPDAQRRGSRRHARSATSRDGAGADERRTRRSSPPSWTASARCSPRPSCRARRAPTLHSRPRQAERDGARAPLDRRPGRARRSPYVARGRPRAERDKARAALGGDAGGARRGACCRSMPPTPSATRRSPRVRRRVRRATRPGPRGTRPRPLATRLSLLATRRLRHARRSSRGWSSRAPSSRRSRRSCPARALPATA